MVEWRLGRSENSGSVMSWHLAVSSVETIEVPQEVTEAPAKNFPGGGKH